MRRKLRCHWYKLAEPIMDRPDLDNKLFRVASKVKEKEFSWDDRTGPKTMVLATDTEIFMARIQGDLLRPSDNEHLDLHPMRACWVWLNGGWAAPAEEDENGEVRIP